MCSALSLTLDWETLSDLAALSHLKNTSAALQLNGENFSQLKKSLLEKVRFLALFQLD